MLINSNDSKRLKNCIAMDMAPYRLSGVVYGTLLNHRPALVALGDQVNQAPYKAAPKAPILYLKPSNTLALDGETITLPAPGDGAGDLVEIGASLGIVIGQMACRVKEASAMDYVAGYIIVSDMSLAHTVFYRPSVALRACDGFCPMGACVVPKNEIDNPDALGVQVFVDGQLRQTTTTGDRQRSVRQLLADVTSFMTLSPGDVLTLGTSHLAPLARAGQMVRVEIEGLGALNNRLEASQ